MRESSKDIPNSSYGVPDQMFEKSDKFSESDWDVQYLHIIVCVCAFMCTCLHTGTKCLSCRPYRVMVFWEN